MKLRLLEVRDAAFMHEWMQDESVVGYLQADFANKKVSDCEAFIKTSWELENNIHLAIVDENDEYMGTVSLKHIDRQQSAAEFAITVRSVAMGKGFSSFAIKEIIRIAHEKLGLDTVYWCVSRLNTRAIRFYDKNGFNRLRQAPAAAISSGKYSKAQFELFLWYEANRTN